MFLRLCDIMRTVIALHRKRLDRRFQLLSLALQSLLRCLFVPGIQRRHRDHPYPPWIFPSTTFNAKHAAAFARVLHTLCDPTLGSAIGGSYRRRRQSGLIDETRKVREYIGQYIPYLLQEFCQGQLRSPLEHELRRALAPGLWACLDVVGGETIKTMLLGMDAPGRAILVSLREEWRIERRTKSR